MPNPKRKHSQARTAKRRTHYKATVKPFYIDAESGEPTLYHRVNLQSGYYRGKKMIDVETLG